MGQPHSPLSQCFYFSRQQLSASHFPLSCTVWPLEQMRPQDNIPQQNSESPMAKPQVAITPVLISQLSANALNSTLYRIL